MKRYICRIFGHRLSYFRYLTGSGDFFNVGYICKRCARGEPK